VDGSEQTGEIRELAFTFLCSTLSSLNLNLFFLSLLSLRFCRSLRENSYPLIRFIESGDCRPQLLIFVHNAKLMQRLNVDEFNTGVFLWISHY